jgi:hypothetical protein
MIFIKCLNESVLQVNDKTRIDVSGSFVSSGVVTDVEIQPESTGDFISVFNANQSKWFLDWAYETDGVKTISVRVTTDEPSVKTMAFETEVLTEAQDNLYSTDSDIFAIESELRKYINPGRNSYLNIHREAQSRILAWLDLKRVWKNDNSQYTKNEINLLGELNKWSLYEAIHIIYTDLFLSVGDKFQEKMNQYRDLRNQERTRNTLRLDKNGDGVYEKGVDTTQDFKTFRMYRR